MICGEGRAVSLARVSFVNTWESRGAAWVSLDVAAGRRDVSYLCLKQESSTLVASPVAHSVLQSRCLHEYTAGWQTSIVERFEKTRMI